MSLENEYAAYCLDGAVVVFGTAVENALYERVEVGVGASKKSIAKWTLEQILEPSFRLPRAGVDDGGDLSLLKGGDYYDEVS